MTLINCAVCGTPTTRRQPSFTVSQWTPPESESGRGALDILGVYCPLCAIRKGIHPLCNPPGGVVGPFFVLLEHGDTGETALVEFEADTATEAKLWGDDCDRFPWSLVAVIQRRPLVMSRQSFDTLASEMEAQRNG